MEYNRICVLDTETTDRYWNTCAPVQIAAVICDNKGNIIDSFNERITNIEKYNGDAINLTKERKPEYKVVTLKVYDKRNTLERSMLHFAHFEKQVEKLDEETYMVHIKYDKDDETELVIRALSFGPTVEVIEPEAFRNLIIERLKKQKALM